MEQSLEKIWLLLGVPQIWGAILTVLALGIAYLLKKLIDQHAEKSKADREKLSEQFNDIAEFVKLQSVALSKAYLRLFESKDALEAQGKQFSEIVEKVDNEIMKPLRQFSVKLDSETKNKIFHVHNILAQFYPEASHDAIQGFKTRKVEFYRLTDDTIQFLRPDFILKRLGVVSRSLNGANKE